MVWTPRVALFFLATLPGVAVTAQSSCTAVYTAAITLNSNNFGVGDVAVGGNRYFDVTLYDSSGNSIDGSSLPPACNAVTVSLSSPSGQIAFPNGTTTISLLTTQKALPVSGVKVSTTDSDSAFSVSGSGFVTKTKSLTVVSASLTALGQQGTMLDAGARASSAASAYFSATNGYALGQVFNQNGTASGGCGIGVELEAVILPKNYKGALTIMRVLSLSKNYIGSTLNQTKRAKLDLSSAAFQTNIADANGMIYDLDAPGIGAAANQIYRVRQDFSAAVLFGTHDQVQSQIITSNVTAYEAAAAVTPTTNLASYFSRSSCTASSNNTYQFVSDIVNDNIEGPGCTSLAWDLSGSSSCNQ